MSTLLHSYMHGGKHDIRGIYGVWSLLSDLIIPFPFFFSFLLQFVLLKLWDGFGILFIYFLLSGASRIKEKGWAVGQGTRILCVL